MITEKYVKETLNKLKDFQLATVNYTIKQFYENNKSKMLIADEVGLGKTIVARGIIARMYEKLNGSKDFNVIYICSNQAIAKQNLAKLNFFSGSGAENIIDYSTDDDRITALAYKPREFNNDFQFRIKAFTPATSFDNKSSTGKSDERILLFRLLYEHPSLTGNLNSLKWFFKGNRRMNENNWENAIEDAVRFDSGKALKHYYTSYRPLRDEIKSKYHATLHQPLPISRFQSLYSLLDIGTETSCIEILECICHLGLRKNNYHLYYLNFTKFISHLRFLLSDCCKDYLEADLFILDEFQRYNKLIKVKQSDDPGIELARQVLSKKGARVLMLSATPFKLFTNDFDELHGEHHFKEFRNVLQFLLKDEQEPFWKEYESNRSLFFNNIRHVSKIGENYDVLNKSREQLEGIYRTCINRTERMIVSKEKDAMIRSDIRILDVRQEDISDFVNFDKIICHLNEHHSSRLPIPVEYAKSCPFPLSFLSNYQHKKKLEKHYSSDPALQGLIKKSKNAWLNLGVINGYKPLIPARSKFIPNPKIRLLFDETLSNGGWKYLWIPPSLPYYKMKGAFRQSESYTKTLLFSSWKMVPRMVSSIVSYEAERYSIGELAKKNPEKKNNYFAKKRYPNPLLIFRQKKEDNSLSGMNNLMLNYPSSYLSSIYDPESNVKENFSLTKIKEELSGVISARLKELNIFDIGNDDGDWQKWSWYSVLLLDIHHQSVDDIRNWLITMAGNDVAVDIEDEGNKENQSGKEKHLQQIKNIVCYGEQPNLSKITPEQFNRVVKFLVDLCIGSPAVCALRTLKKTCKEDNSVLLGNAYNIASGFITMFNKPEHIAVVQLNTKEKEYYSSVLKYCIDGNFQSMLDEYVYLLFDSNSIENSGHLSSLLTGILTIKPSSFEVGCMQHLGKDKEGKFKRNSRLRTHFALDFGEQKISSSSNRQINIREAFNSPFRPFVLASTSIGQEGLDFHFYSKKIIHWNLPGNPIDFEQREGRIHRYKGHVIRLNVAEKYKHELQNITNDTNVWSSLSECAAEQELKEAVFGCDLIPFWHVESENDISIERIVPLYPFSKDIDKYQNMLKVLAYYRFTFGQPRQEELIEILKEHFNENDQDLINRLTINLSPICFNETH